MRFPQFIGSSYMLPNVNYDCQRCVNLYPEKDEPGAGKEGEVAQLVGTPGLLLAANVGTGPTRGTFTASNGVLYVASAGDLYSVSAANAVTHLAPLLTTSGPVQMADNGVSLCVVDGPYGYVLEFATGIFGQITDPDFHGADCVVFLDGYFIFNWPGTGRFYISALEGTDFDAMDFATAEGNPDVITSIIANNRELWLFGTESTEVWFDSGDPDFPFARIQGAFTEHGCVASQSPARLNNTVFWLGQDDRGSGIVWMAQGYIPQRISTHALEIKIQALTATQIAGAVSYVYQQQGHGFYALSIAGLDSTWVYDVDNGLWHERCWTNAIGVLERHRVVNHAFAYGKHYVGDYATSALYNYSMTTYKDNGGPITRVRTSPHLAKGMKRIFYHSFELDMRSGVGLDGSNQLLGKNPQAMLRWSDDGGNSWSNEHWQPIGRIGEFGRRVRWTRLGQSRNRVFDVRIVDPVPVFLIGAELEVTQGAS